MSSTEAWRVLTTRLPPLDRDSAFWWYTTGTTVANMLYQAGYDQHAQYNSLIFYYYFIISRLGSRPTTYGKSQGFESYTTDDFSPIEYSWSWAGLNKSPKIRFAIEAIGPESGTSADPFNQNMSMELINHLRSTLPGIDLQLFHHFWNTLLVTTNDAETTKRINTIAEPNSHRSSLFIACELGGSEMLVKVYFMPMLRALQTGQSRIETFQQSMHQLTQTITPFPALQPLFTYLTTSPLGAQLELEMISVDCIDPSKSRIKVYFRSPQTSFDAIRAILSLDGLIPISSVTWTDLQAIYRLVFGLPDSFQAAQELPPCRHSTAGMFFCFFARAGDALLTPKLSLPAKHYGKDDRSVALGLATFMGERGRGQWVGGYLNVLEGMSAHRKLGEGLGLHTYVACQVDEGGLRVTSYLGPEIYDRRRWGQGRE